jgi:hypothetical protein
MSWCSTGLWLMFAHPWLMLGLLALLVALMLWLLPRLWRGIAGAGRQLFAAAADGARAFLTPEFGAVLRAPSARDTVSGLAGDITSHLLPAAMARARRASPSAPLIRSRLPSSAA